MKDMIDMPNVIFEPDFFAFKNISSGKEKGATQKRTGNSYQKLKKYKYVKLKPSGGNACAIASAISTTGGIIIE